MIRKKIAIIFCTVICVLILQGQSYAQTTFPSGTAIIDMGSASPTVGNSLKPYGLIYGLLKSKHVPVSVVINANKVKDGIDFVYNNKSYKGGTFVISSDYISSDVTAYLNSWANQGITIDYTSASAGDLTVNVTYKINFAPKWVLDKSNRSIAVGFLNAAGIPSSAYSFKDVSDLGACDDIFILPHADPTWNTHNNLYFWNKNYKGAIWAGCHAVSVLEGLSKDTTIGGTPQTVKMNFLSTNGLLSFTDHRDTIPPYKNLLPGDPIAQFYNKPDSAQIFGSEIVYLPKIGSAWNSGAKIISTNPSQPGVPSLSPGPAVVNIYGRAFDDASRGYVAYQAAHNIGGTSADQIAAQRIFFNFSLYALTDKVPPIISASLSGNSNQITSGTAASLTATVTGTGTGFKYKWTSTVGGTFSSDSTATTTFTPNSVTSATSAILTCVVTESCGRVSFDSKKITIVPPSSSYTLLNRDTTLNVSGSCTVAFVKFNVFTNNPDASAGPRTLLSVTGLGNGTLITNTNGDVTFTSTPNFKGKTSGTYIVTNGVSNSPSAAINIIVGDSTFAPSLANDAASVMVDNVVAINVLGNDLNKPGASNGSDLYIRDITTKPGKGFVYINTDGTLSYVSTKDPSSVSGGDSFQYLACNTNTNYCSVATVNITLTQDGCSSGQYQLTTTGTTSSTSFSPTIDSYVQSNSATNFGSTSTFLLNGVNSATRKPLLKFDLSSISTSATVNSAALSLTTSATFTPTATTTPFPVTIYGVNKAWKEGEVNNANAATSLSWAATGIGSSDYSDLSPNNPTIASQTLGVAVNLTTVLQSTDMKNIVSGWVSTPSNNNGIVLVPTVATTSLSVNFHSRQAASSTNYPYLAINYTTPAACLTTPTTFNPIAYPDTTSTSSNTAVTINVKSNDANYYGNTNSVTAVSSTSWKGGTVTINGSNNVVYTPSGSFVGIDTLTYTITDGTNGKTTTSWVRINVTKVAPKINRDSTSTNSNTAVTINVGSNDTDPQLKNSETLSAPTVTTLPKNGTATVSGNNIVYTPSANFKGSDTLIYKRSGIAADSCSTALSDTAIVVITVLNQAPVTANDSVTTLACLPVTIKIKDNDTDPEKDALTVTIVTNPSNGTLSANSDGSYKYSPNANYIGTDQFTYTVKDAGNLTSNTATVKITVTSGTNTNVAPKAVNDADNTLTNQPLYTNVLANDSDSTNDPITISITASGLKAPSNGTIQLMTNNLIKYIPNANFSGTDTYEYQITDTHPSCSGNSSLSAKAKVTITVKPLPILTGGTIWNDVDYSANDSFNNIKTNSETGTNPNGSIYVYLLDSTNKVIDYTPADDAGVYQLSSVPANTSKLSLIITTDIIAIGGTISTPVLPSSYINTSPMVRTFSTTTADITGYDFGIVTPSVTGGTITTTATSFCVSGSTAIITSSVDASGATSVQWQSSTTSGGSGFTNISGATSSTYTPPSTISTTIWYRRKAIGSGGAYSYSNVLRLAVNPLPTISVSPTVVGTLPGTTTSMTASGASTYTWSPATNLSTTTGATVTVTPAAVGTIAYTVRGTDDNGCSNTTQINVSGTVLPVAGSISGPCAVVKDSVKTYSVTATNATSFVWTLPGGWSGSSTTSSINAKPGTFGGTISVVPYNGTVAGLPVTFNVSVIDHGQVTLTGLPVTASGNNNSPITVTVTLYDANGNRINCSGGTAIVKFCENNPGTFTPVVDNNDGTYTTTVTASANTLDICGTVGGPPIVNKSRVTFTGPQGSIKASVPQLATETPKLTFTMSAGRAPFTVIYKSAKSTKNDTLTNYASATVTPVALIPSTTLYTLVSIIDANGERRDNNFTRDTASVVVLAPKVIITLKADAAIPDKDSTWITILRVRTKNIGDLDLTNSQAKLDLKTVFPNPVTFKLDSVKYSGITITPNRSYDGISASDLFAKLNNRSKNGKAIEMVPLAEELGGNNIVPQPNYATDDNSVDGFRVFTNIKGAGSIAEDEPVVVEDGHSLYMFGPQSYLPIGVEADIILYLHVKPNGYTDPFVMQAVALGTGTTDGATALTTSVSNDNNDINSHPEITKQGDPIPTVINLFPRAVIGSSLSAGSPVLQGNGSYNVPFTLKLKNYGNLNLQSVQVGLNLLRSIGLPSTFSLVGTLVSTGDLLLNSSYDGKADTNMLAANSILGYNKGFSTITFTINIVTNQLSSIYRLQATAYGFSDQLNATVNDLSTDGADPDPDGNNIPSEKIKTVVVINLPIPPLVPGNIGIQTGPTTTVAAKAYCITATGVVIIPTTLNSGGTDPYEYQWQSSADNVTFTDIVGSTDSTFGPGTFATSTYVRRQTISGSQFKFSNSVYVQVYPSPAKPVISGTVTQVVGRGNSTLTSSTGSLYSWSTGETTRSIIARNAGNYTVSVTDANGCSNTSDVYAITALNPYKVADLEKVVSKVPVLQSDGTFIIGFTFYSYNLRSELLDTVRIKDDLSKVFPAGVDYQVAQISASGKLKANALYNGNSQTDLLSDISQLAGLTKDSIQVYLKVSPNGYSGTLYNSAVLTATSPFGTFSVTSNDPTIGNGTAVRQPTPFTIPLVDIFIPSGFSPNHDGVNDNFVIAKPFGTTINLEIFNRWGNAVFKAADYKNEWDGRGNQPNNILGEMLPDGTYYYVATATDKFTGGIRKFAGFVTLKR